LVDDFSRVSKGRGEGDRPFLYFWGIGQLHETSDFLIIQITVYSNEQLSSKVRQNTFDSINHFIRHFDTKQVLIMNFTERISTEKKP
jgi:hypothetical protein